MDDYVDRIRTAASVAVVLSLIGVGSFAADVACMPAVDVCSPVAGAPACCGNRCRPICYPKTDQVNEEKTCWVVKREQVAVPAITLPWEQGGSPLTLFNCLRTLIHPHKAKGSCTKCGGARECCDMCHCCSTCCMCGPSRCGPARCGKVRCVRQLDEESCDVQKCETTWEIGCVPCCGNCGHCSHCCTR